MGKVVITRRVSFLVDRLPLTLWVDENEVGSLSVVHRKEVVLSPGSHSLQVKNPLFSFRSNSLLLSLSKKETVALALSLRPAAALYLGGGLVGLLALMGRMSRPGVFLLLLLWTTGLFLFFRELFTLGIDRRRERKQ